MTIRALGSLEAFNQEYGNEFRAAGDNIFDKDQLDTMEQSANEVVYEDDDRLYKIYKDRVDGRFYSIGVDVGEGIGRANSCIQVVDITDVTNIEQVATYANNKLDPFNFAGRLVEIAHEWGRPPLLIERNNCGAQVIDALVHTHNYESIVKYTPSMGTFTDKVDKDNRSGIYSHTNSKFNGMSNLRYWMSTLRTLKISDKRTIDEFKTYVRQPNGVWKKQSDRYLDDRVEALIWSLFVLDTKVIEQFYEVVEKDGNGKPLKVLPLNWDPFEVAESRVPKQEELYNRFGKTKQEAQNSIRNPAFTGNKDRGTSDIDELIGQGWKPVNIDNTGYRNYGFIS